MLTGERLTDGRQISVFTNYKGSSDSLLHALAQNIFIVEALSKSSGAT